MDDKPVNPESENVIKWRRFNAFNTDMPSIPETEKPVITIEMLRKARKILEESNVPTISMSEFSQEMARAYDQRLLYSAPMKFRSFGDDSTENEPQTKPSWQQRLAKALRTFREDVVQAIHNWSTKHGAYCSCDCGDW